MINDEDVFIVNDAKYISSELGEEMILLNLDSGDYINLNSVSADIWKQAEKEATAQQIIDHLLREYEVEEEVCRTETLTCIDEMLKKELLIKK